MNLVSFSIKTKGIPNFARRLWTVFTRFGFSEARTRKALNAILDSLRPYNSVPTFFIPAVVLGRHSGLMAEIAGHGAQIDVHGYFHNDYRTLSAGEQYKQTERAVSVFQSTHIMHQGFRNPYLGWTKEALLIFAALGFIYESNEAVIHDVIDFSNFSPLLRSGFEKSLALFQAIPRSTYALRPHFEGSLLRIPTSIPDDEMLFDRLRLKAEEVGRTWSKVMQHVYERGGLYTLNLHPERGVLGKKALDILLSYAHNLPLPVWLASLPQIAQWWKERSQFTLDINAVDSNRWRVEANCTPRATLLARHVSVEDQPARPWSGSDVCVDSHSFIVNAEKCPCLGLSGETPQEVAAFLHEQGYPAVYCSQEDADSYVLYLDVPAGLGTTREEQLERRSRLVQEVEQLEGPFIHFGCWPGGRHAALAVTGDIDSVTIQDFFLRVLEVA